jgi:hemoglobin-like flavoprotein
MTEADIALVQRTLERAAKIAPHVAATFYSELFALDSSLRPMFKGDMVAQGAKLMSMLADIAGSLGNADDLDAKVRELALRHAGYGVQSQHYTLVGTALIRTLRHELGADFTPELRSMWVAAYQRVADAMRKVAYGAGAERQP